MVGSFAAYVARTAYVLIGCAGLLSLLAACATVGVAPSTPTAVPISREQQVWTMPSLYRVGQHDAPGVDPDASIAAARGEYESFQIIVRAPRGGLRNLGLSLSAFVGPDGAQIGGKDVTLYRAHYVQVVQPSHDPQTGNRPSGAGWYADALIPLVDPESGGKVSGGEIPAMPALLAAGQNQPFWIDVFIPRDSPPGKYAARYTFSSDKGTSVGNVTLTVWNFELPILP